MWSPSRPNGSPSQPSAPEPKPTSTTVSSAPAVKSPRSDERITYIGKSLVIKGEVSGSEPIHIEGKIEGPISLRDCHINVGRDAVVSSNMQAGEVIIRGTVDGNVTASDRVEVHSGGSLTGNVCAGRISIEYGAYYHGKVDMRLPDPKAHFSTNDSDSRKKSESVATREEAPALATY
ncbi:MAG: cell shape determination protein CcmA [Acidobacteria bacterium]|nr:MAG: cell shape determination protein CcmA [Acidobacteriota bacterium]PYY21484.1 MAG: cell shape determination protein CcmA [Acidobacteriota bacterium]